MKLQSIVLFGILTSTLLNVAAAKDVPKEITIQPNKKVQQFLYALSHSDSKEGQKLLQGITTEKEFRKKLGELKTLAGSSQKLVVQLLYLSIHSTTIMEAMMAGTVVEYLPISKKDIFYGVLPYLDAKEAKLRKESRQYLSAVDTPISGNKPNFSYYKEVLRKQKAKPPLALIEYMCQYDRYQTLEILSQIYLKKEAAKRLLDRVKKFKTKFKTKDDTSLLEELSKRFEWWVHLYVSETIRQGRRQYPAAIVNRLKKTVHPLVKSSVQKIKASRIKKPQASSL